MTATPSERSATASVTAPALPSVRRLLLLLVLGCLLPGAIGAVMLFTHLFVEGDQQL